MRFWEQPLRQLEEERARGEAALLRTAAAILRAAPEFADPGYQRDGIKRYPIDTEEHIRAAWSYIHQQRNAGKYSAEHLAAIRRRIVAAWKREIDPEGPPEAAA